MKTTCITSLAIALLGAWQAALAQEAAQVFEKAAHAVYMVTVTTDDLGVVDVVAQGSAVLVGPGRLVTRCHVIDRGSVIHVSRRDQAAERVRVLDRNPQADLCELGLANPKPGFDRPAELAPPDALRVDDPVFAVGSPQGLELSVRLGVVLDLRDNESGTRVIQTTAPLDPGFSGAGLFDARGRLVGIAAFVREGAHDQNLAVAALHVKNAGVAASERGRPAAVREVAGGREQRTASPAPQIQAQASPPATTPRPSAATAPSERRNARQMADYLAMLDRPGDPRPARIHERMAKAGELDGLDDGAIARKVYGELVTEQVRSHVRWTGAGTPVAQFQVELRRNGEIMYVLPLKSSGQESFDREAQRAIGVASPFPVPRDDGAYAQVRSLVVDVSARR